MAKTQHILFLAREIPYPPNSGVRMRVWHVLRQLAETHRVSLLCYGAPEEKIPAEVTQVCARIMRVNPLRARKGAGLYGQALKGLFSSLPFAVTRRFSQKLKLAAANFLEREQVDVLMCDSLYLAMHVPFGRAVTVLNEHNIESVIISRYAETEKNSLKKLYALYELSRIRRFENRIWSHFDWCWTCSDVDRKEVRRRVPSAEVSVIPNGVDTTVLKPSRSPRKPGRLVYTGLIGWKPNEDAVLYFVGQIYPLIKKKFPEVSMAVVGKGPSTAVRDLSRQDPSITVTGFVDDIKPYIEESEVVVVPLRIGSGTRLKILEAMAMAKAIVSTAVGAEGLHVTDGKNIMLADTPEMFAAKVTSVLSDPRLRQSLESEARWLVEQEYAWDVIGRKIKELL